MVLQFLTLFGAIGLFLYGLNLLSGGLMKLTGDRMKNFLPWMKKNPVNSILSGFCITTLAESSSAATVTVVSFVNAGVLALTQAILVIMGANIGASFTTWIIALAGFDGALKFMTYPLIAIGFVLTMAKGQKKKITGEVVIGLALLFIGLSFMISTFPPVTELPSLKAAIDNLAGSEFLCLLMFMAVGCVLAFAMQSTGAVTLTMVMMTSGWINFDMAAAMVLGENIGTTISANIAASDANIQAKRAALVHTLFNVVGAVLALISFKPFTGFVAHITEGWHPVFAIATLHTLFNVLGTCILAWFTKPIEKLVTKLVSADSEIPDDGSRLIYISARRFGAPSISISQAFKEVAHFAAVMKLGFVNVANAVNEKDPDKFESFRVKLVQSEEQSDKMEYQIAAFLNSVSAESISEEEAEEIKVLYRVIGELESLGDSGENISRILERERVHNRKFDEATIEKINLMISKVDLAYGVMVENLDKAANGYVRDIANAYNAEDVINGTRDKLREEGIAQIESHTGNYQSLNYFLDIIAELEAMGDFMINVSQAVVRNDN